MALVVTYIILHRPSDKYLPIACPSVRPLVRTRVVFVERAQKRPYIRDNINAHLLTSLSITVSLLILRRWYVNNRYFFKINVFTRTCGETKALCDT